MGKIVNLTGKRFGKLLVIDLAGGSRNGSKLWNCQCDCGNTKLVTTRHLNRNPKTNSVVRSCGCLNNNQKVGKDNPWFQGYGQISRGYFTRHITKSAKKRSITGNEIEVNIDEKYLDKLFKKQNGKCIYTGIDITLPKKWNDKHYTASVDRIDSSKGYIKGNVQFVHRHINIMKNMYSHKYFIKMCKLVSDNH